jgi:hypothetical protein
MPKMRDAAGEGLERFSLTLTKAMKDGILRDAAEFGGSLSDAARRVVTDGLEARAQRASGAATVTETLAAIESRTASILAILNLAHRPADAEDRRVWRAEVDALKEAILNAVR